MAKYRQTNTLAEVDAAYIAGIIDGEGTITLSRRHRNENRQLVVSISSTERNLLEYVLNTTGIGKITRKRTTSHSHSRSYAWSASNRQALALLDQITPFLKTYKAERARLILEHYVQLTPRNGHYTPEMLKARYAFCIQVLTVRPH